MVGVGPAGDLEVVGRLADASNATFLARDEREALWIYKPVAGERPLWDYPRHTLSRREVAAYLLSEHLGFGVVPLTVWGEGPFGEGSLQSWVEGEITDLVDLLKPEDLDETWLPVASGVDGEGHPVVLAHRDDPALRNMCLFDLVINNTDRKVGHLIDDGGHLFGVDHGVSLSVEEKYRTVLWGFMGQPLHEEDVARLELAAALDLEPPPGLDGDEWRHVAIRAEGLLAAGVYPEPSGNWPAIPWPPW